MNESLKQQPFTDAQKADRGWVNPGWTAAAWRARLLQMAERCEGLHPERAAELRRWAENVSRPEPERKD